METETTIKELARFLNISEIEARRRVHNYNTLKQLGAEWENSPHATPEEIREFYRKTENYLYELIQWNSTPVFHQKVEPLLYYRRKKILELGAGNGTLCISLALNGNKVTYYDINEPCKAFAKQRFEDRLLDIEIAESLDHLRDYDIVVGIDFFEHLHKDDLDAMLKTIQGVLKDGGFLYERSNWYQQEILPMHFDHSTQFAKMLKEIGFNLRGNGDWVKGSLTAGVMVGIITLGNTMRNDMVRALMNMDIPPHSTLTVKEGGQADHARNFLVKSLTKDWLFFMDSDQTFAPDALKRLLSWNVDIVSGLIFHRTGPPVPMFYKYEWQQDRGHYYRPLTMPVGEYLQRHRDLWKEAKNGAIVLPPAEKGLLEIDGVPCGCLLVHRRVFEAIKEPWFQWGEGLTAGEDFYFCRKAQEAGFKIYGDPSVICGHLSEYVRGPEHFWAWSMKEEFPWPGDIKEAVKDNV